MTKVIEEFQKEFLISNKENGNSKTEKQYIFVQKCLGFIADWVLQRKAQWIWRQVNNREKKVKINTESMNSRTILSCITYNWSPRGRWEEK